MLKNLLILGLISFSFAQNIPSCIVQCQTAGSANGCPARSTCRNVSPDNTIPRLICICNDPTTTSCVPSDNGLVNLVCGENNSTTSTGCGVAFPNGCPTGATCVSSATGQRTCVCNTAGAYLDVVNFRCVSPCPAFAARDSSGVCQCVAPYVRDTSVNELRCILGGGATCANVQCPQGYHCEIPSTGATPICVADPNSQVCGVDFRCPTPFVCVDTTRGPVCKCPEGFAGPNCQFRRCWTLAGSTDLGCWSMQNGSAVCVVSNDADPFCRCAAGLLPPNCDATDNSCANVNCGIVPNSRCINGRCVCIDGYIAAPSATDPTTFTCRPAGNTCNCSGNTVCDSTGRCVCPADRFGGADCSRPACASNDDCTNAGLVHSYCVRNTNDGVRGFCVCAPGYTGEKCDIADNTCDATRCPNRNMVCTNEGRCVCAPGFNGTNCTRPATPQCITITILVRASAASTLTADQLKAVLAAFIGVDQSLINVTGPITLERNNTFVAFVIRICRDSSTNEQSAGDQFVDDVNSGNAAAYGIESAKVGDITEDSSSSNNSAIISLSILLLCIAAMFA